MKKIIIGVIILIVVVLLIVSNGKNKEIDVEKGEIKVGATLPITGSLAFVGEAEMRGLSLAAEEINANGGIDGRELVLVIEDNEGKPDTAVSNVQKLLSVDDVDVMFSAFTHITQSIKTVVANADKPMMYAASVASIAEENPLFFRDYFDGINLGTVLATRMTQDEDVSEVAYLGENGDACNPYLDEVKRVLSEGGIELAMEEKFQPDATDLRTSLTKIKAANIDTIVTCTWRKSDVFMKQLKELDMMDIQTYQTTAIYLPNANTDEMKELYEENGSVTTWYGFSEGSLNNKQEEFSQKFEGVYGSKPNSDAAFAYDDLNLIADNLETCFSDAGLDNDCFSKEMTKSIYDGVGGELSFDENGVSQKDGILIKVVDGEWVLAE